MHARRRTRFGVSCTLAIAPLLGVAACGDDPVEVEFQVIEETEFAASLNIDLAQMEMLSTGVYRQDLVPGAGDALVLGDRAYVQYTGWLSDGIEFGAGAFDFLVGNAEVIPGFEDGLIGIQPGGTRLLVIPPERAYGSARVGPIPPGSIVVFRVTLVSLG